MLDVECETIVSLYSLVLGSGLGAIPWSRIVSSVVVLGMWSNIEEVVGSICWYVLVLLEVKIW